MAGHSKWNNIKNKKGAEDAKRAQIFTGLVKNIRIAAKKGGEVESNPSLRLWVEKAKAANMPQEINYEGFGPNGVALIIMTITDNTNRTSAELRAILTRAGGSLASPGSAGFMFKFNKEEQIYETIIPIEVDEETKERLEELKTDLSQVEGVEEIFMNVSK